MADTSDKNKILREQIIETIRQHPVLYDSKVQCRKELREALWEEIADTFDLDVQILKVKWKNLRDCYKKHIRAQTDDSKALSSYKYWQWSKYMEFLRPHIRSYAEVSYPTDDNFEARGYSENFLNVKLEDADNTNFGSDSEATVCKQPAKSKEKRVTNFESDSDPLECVIEQPNWKKRRINADPNENLSKIQSNLYKNVHEFDDVELIFLGYAKTVKKMPLKRQINIKMKIAKIMMEEELKSLDDEAT
ncbi:uncharacterized protein LOC125237734 [Leguminivora glycinivorella]|uniref:uncharacterized protein LOC125237734 n=1 Tax=Leguminivora glycinivorella TaxID=1035111 RepID=UPI00200F2DB5|nr:uncharacterized protein LOC125237734 [Leguminivora glycinivorella]